MRHFSLGSGKRPLYFVLMPNVSEIPHLLNLLDDESADVQEMIRAALMSFGPALEKETLPYLQQLDAEKLVRLQSLYQVIRTQNFEQHWPQWIDTPGYAEPLEQAFSSLAQLDFGFSRPPLASFIDDLATQFAASTPVRTSQALMHFLFQQKRLGPPQSAYYEAHNSNLIHVIESKEGLQISLAAIAILTGHRLGIELFGLGIPGHFMLMSTDGTRPLVLDPFSQGRPILPAAASYLLNRLQLDNYEALFSLKASPGTILMRVLRNIMNAWDRKGDSRQVAFYRRASEKLHQALKAKH